MTSALVNDHPCIIQADNAPMWSSSMVACLIFSAVMHSRMSVHVHMVSMLRVIPGISSFQFSLWLHLNSQLAINNWIPSLYRILVLY